MRSSVHRALGVFIVWVRPGTAGHSRGHAETRVLSQTRDCIYCHWPVSNSEEVS